MTYTQSVFFYVFGFGICTAIVLLYNILEELKGITTILINVYGRSSGDV